MIYREQKHLQIDVVMPGACVETLETEKKPVMKSMKPGQSIGIWIITAINDGLYEVRTVVAMSLRTAVWTLIATFAYRKIILR